MERVELWVEGAAAPGGSKSAFPFMRKSGKMGVRVVDAGKGNKEWREEVAALGRAAMEARCLRAPLTGAIKATVQFILNRPKSVTRHFHTVKPDATKLWRAAEDALTKIVWVDDAQIVEQSVTKRYAGVGQPCGCYVTVQELE